MNNFNPAQPIYFQLMQKICQQIVRGDLNAGDKLPSVREMALQYNVNPNTVQRAYNELERIEVAETRRGLGTFVTEDKSRLEKLREQLKEERIKSFIKDMTEMGFSSTEIINGVQNCLRIM